LATGILKLSKDSRPFINPNTGKALLQVRIDSVSKNHDNHDFALMLGVHNSAVPTGYVILPSTSTPVTVMSKRNRRGKKRDKVGGAGGGGKRARPGVLELDKKSTVALASWCAYAKGLLAETLTPDHEPNCKVALCVRSVTMRILVCQNHLRESKPPF
jgi:hypothetical protein